MPSALETYFTLIFKPLHKKQFEILSQNDKNENVTHPPITPKNARNLPLKS